MEKKILVEKYLFIAITFYLDIEILRVKILCVNKALGKYFFRFFFKLKRD